MWSRDQSLMPGRPAFGKLRDAIPLSAESIARIRDFDRFALVWWQRCEQLYPGIDFEPICYAGLYNATCTYNGRSTFVGWLRRNLMRESHAAIRTWERRREILTQIDTDMEQIQDYRS